MYQNKRGRGGRRAWDEHSATETPETQILPSLTPRGAKFREELLAKILPWQQLTVSLHNFPYYIQEHTKSLLVECVEPILKHNKLRKYCGRLNSSSQKILLRSIPGTELYRERLVSALARDMQVPLLKLDDDHGFDDEEDGIDDEVYADESDSDEEDYKKIATTFRKGDRVMYHGRTISFKEVNNRSLLNGQRGEVYKVKGSAVGVVFNICSLKANKAEKDDKSTEIPGKSIVIWLHEKDVQKDVGFRIHDCHIAMEVLYEVMESQQPVIVFFADSFMWPPSYAQTRMKSIFDQLPEGVVMICPENISLDELEKEEAMQHNPQRYQHNLQRCYEPELHKIFTNMVFIKPPTDEDLLDRFHEQIEEDRLTFISEANLKTMHKVLKDRNLSCMNLEHPIFGDKMLKRKKVEKIVGWALNHYISSCPLSFVNEEKLHIPDDSTKLAISRFAEEMNYTYRPKKILKSIQDHEKWLVSAAVALSEDIGVKFDDVGVLENVKKTLYETVILPMRRPELFSHGNLSRFYQPCKGILLFGPPGTGKSLIAKALATKSGANLINITAATFTHMSFETLFSCARKLDPVIIYLDEVDSFQYDKRKLNEFMAAWDSWKTKETKRIFLIGAANRPFDLDQAFIRHMPRRIYVGIPDLETRSKILKIILDKENLESGFSFDKLAEATEGYSGSDLKNLCVAASYRPIEEFVEQESKGEASNGVPALRPLNLNDFIHSKSKVMMREWNEQYGEEYCQGQMQQ